MPGDTLSDQMEAADRAAIENNGLEPVDAPATACGGRLGKLMTALQGRVDKAAELMKKAVAAASDKIDEVKQSEDYREAKRMWEHRDAITARGVHAWFTDFVYDWAGKKATEDAPGGESP